MVDAPRVDGSPAVVDGAQAPAVVAVLGVGGRGTLLYESLAGPRGAPRLPPELVLVDQPTEEVREELAQDWLAAGAIGAIVSVHPNARANGPDLALLALAIRVFGAGALGVVASRGGRSGPGGVAAQLNRLAALSGADFVPVPSRPPVDVWCADRRWAILESRIARLAAEGAATARAVGGRLARPATLDEHEVIRGALAFVRPHPAGEAPVLDAESAAAWTTVLGLARDGVSEAMDACSRLARYPGGPATAGVALVDVLMAIGNDGARSGAIVSLALSIEELQELRRLGRGTPLAATVEELLVQSAEAHGDGELARDLTGAVSDDVASRASLVLGQELIARLERLTKTRKEVVMAMAELQSASGSYDTWVSALTPRMREEYADHVASLDRRRHLALVNAHVSLGRASVAELRGLFGEPVTYLLAWQRRRDRALAGARAWETTAPIESATICALVSEIARVRVMVEQDGLRWAEASEEATWAARRQARALGSTPEPMGVAAILAAVAAVFLLELRLPAGLAVGALAIVLALVARRRRAADRAARGDHADADDDESDDEDDD